MEDRKQPTEVKDEGRRKFVIGLLGAGLLSVLASTVSLVKSLVPGKSEKSGYLPTVAEGDVLVFASGERMNEPVTLEDLAVGEGVLAFPKGKNDNQANLTMVVRLNPDDFKPPTIVEWTDRGVVAYSALCTHLSCTASWAKKESLEGSEIECFCHNSIFDPRRGAVVLAGPAPVPLPQLPIKVNEQGFIIAAGTFEGPVGPQA